jgi:GntR family galactonate operon transcriptional repressor
MAQKYVFKHEHMICLPTMETTFTRVRAPENLHSCVTRTLALQIMGSGEQVIFPNEARLCQQLGVSRSILREAVKVLEDKGLLEVRPRLGMRSTPRTKWNLLDPDILSWHTKLHPDARLLRDLCEVRLAIEPTAAGFAAVRATPQEIHHIEKCLEQRESVAGMKNFEEIIDLNLRFHTAVVAASHNALFEQLSAIIREPLRIALSYTVQLPASVALELSAYRTLLDAISGHQPIAARAAAEEIVGYAMLAVEQVLRLQEADE